MICWTAIGLWFVVSLLMGLIISKSIAWATGSDLEDRNGDSE